MYRKQIKTYRNITGTTPPPPIGETRERMDKGSGRGKHSGKGVVRPAGK